MVRVCIVRGPGTNCDMETGFAFTLAGADVRDIHILRLKENPSLIREYQILVFPGGFTYGDYLGAGTVFSFEIRRFLYDEVKDFIEKGGLVLGICNGFQILVRSGLLPGWNRKAITLGFNSSGSFLDRWVELEVVNKETPFLQGIERLRLPIAHAEGRLSVKDEEARRRLWDGRHVAVVYKENPNGSVDNIAGLVDETGRVFGLMPHPERNIFSHHTKDGGEGLRIFENAVRFFS